jgi:uncharacterized protein YukE
MTTTMTPTTTLPPTDEQAPDAVRINALLAELRVTGKAVDNREWLSAELAGEPAVSLDALGSTASPLSALDGAGVGFLTPMISFLEEPLHQLRGDPDSVSSGAGEFDGAGQSAAAVGEEYRSAAGRETSEWSGESASSYQQTGTDLADGILSIAETSLTSAKAMIGAGEVVAQVIDVVTRLVTEAVGKIVPIMTEAIAAAPATFGQSIAVAIPQCVQIAVDCGVQLAAKLGALLSSGENLIKLIDGALGVLAIVKEGMKFIGEQSQGGGTPSPATSEPEESEESQSGSWRPLVSGQNGTTSMPTT